MTINATGPAGNPCAEINLGGPDWADTAGPPHAPDTMQCRVLQELDAIDGLAMRHVFYKHDDVGRLTGTVTFSGWSPSLHAVTVERSIYADTGGEDEVLFHLHDLLARQRARAADARALGLIGPLRGNGFEMTNHLWTDRTLVAMREADPTLLPIIAQMSKAIKQIHRSGESHNGGPFIADVAGVVAETRWGEKGSSVRMVGAAIDIMPEGFLSDRRRPRGPSPSFDGAVLSIPSEPLPETALIALKGRPVADLARLHPLLDGRVINHVRNSADGARVIAALEPDLMRVMDI